jgi:hypothetical protein
VRDFLDGLSKWPLLLGAVLCYALAIYEETVTDNTEIMIGVAGTVLGSVLLGAWVSLFVIDFERRWVHWRASSGVSLDNTPDTAASGVSLDNTPDADANRT